MTVIERDAFDGRLSKAIVLSTTEDACTVFAAGRRAVVPYADPFPTPRAKRVTPGHLVAVASAANGSGAQWWVAGPAADRAEAADVELDEVEQFFTGLGLWASLS